MEDKILCKNLTSCRVSSTEEATLGLKAPVKGQPELLAVFRPHWQGGWFWRGLRDLHEHGQQQSSAPATLVAHLLQQPASRELGKGGGRVLGWESILVNETWSSVKSCLLPLAAIPTLPGTAFLSCPQAQPWRVPAFQKTSLVLHIKVRVAGSFAHSAEYHVQLPEQGWEANLCFQDRPLGVSSVTAERICWLWELPLPPPSWQKIPKHTEGGNFQQGARPIAAIYF